jgi:hypothetical protein
MILKTEETIFFSLGVKKKFIFILTITVSAKNSEKINFSKKHHVQNLAC